MKALKKLLHRKPSAVFIASMFALALFSSAIYPIVDFTRPYAHALYYVYLAAFFCAVVCGEYTDIYKKERHAGVLNKMEFKQELLCVIILPMLFFAILLSLGRLALNYFFPL